MDANRQVLLRDLREKIRAVEARVFSDAALSTAAANPTPSALRSTGWADIDAAMGGGLAAGGLHEWLGVEFSESATRSPDGHRFSSCGRWSVPLCILVHLARRAAAQDEASRWTLWIGRTCHPYPPLLACKDEHGRALLERSMFVAPRDAAERLWAIDLALHSPAVGCVVADGSRFDRAATQRLQMLARTRLKWALVARPSQERSELSAAQTRWFVRTEPPRPKDAPHGAPLPMDRRTPALQGSAACHGRPHMASGVES